MAACPNCTSPNDMKPRWLSFQCLSSLYSMLLRNAACSSGLSRNLVRHAVEKRIELRAVAVVVPVLEPGREPLLDDTVIVDHVVGHLGEHVFPGGDPVLVAPEFTGGGDRVAQQFLGHGDVHGGVVGRLRVRVARRVFR